MAAFAAFYDANVLYPAELRSSRPRSSNPSVLMRSIRTNSFILHLLHLSPGAVVAAAQTHRLSMKHTPRSPTEYLETLERQGLPRTVSVLREYML